MDDGGSVPGKGWDFFFPLRHVHTCFGAHPTSYLMGIDHSSPSRLRLRGPIPPLPKTSSWRGACLGIETTLRPIRIELVDLFSITFQVKPVCRVI
jgi:hypothetical protein